MARAASSKAIYGALDYRRRQIDESGRGCEGKGEKRKLGMAYVVLGDTVMDLRGVGVMMGW